MKRLTIKPSRLLALTVALGAVQSVTALAQPRTTPQWPNILQYMEPPSEQEQDTQRFYAKSYASSFEEPKINGALNAYALANSEAARPLKFIGVQLGDLLPKPKWSDRHVELLLQDLRARLAVEEQHHATRVQELTAQEGMGTLRMEKFLRLSGQLGDESALVNALPKGLARVRPYFRKAVNSLDEALTEMGVTQAETHAAILRYATDYEADVLPLIRQAETLNLVEGSPKLFARRAGVAAGDEGIRELLTRYTASVADFKVQRDQKLRLLDQEIHFSKNPRLDATLALLGFTDINMALLDAPSDSGGASEFDSYARSNDPVTGEKREPTNMAYAAWIDEMKANIKYPQAKVAVVKDGQPK